MEKFHNDKGKIIGVLNGGVFSKSVKGSKHLMRIFDAWGLEERVVKKLADICEEVRVTDTESGTVYSTTPDIFREKGIAKNFDTPQIFLPRKEWKIINPKQEALL